MVVQKVNFPSILKENEETYFRYLEGIVSSVDIDASILFNKKGEAILIRISPSSPDRLNIILSEMKKFHTMLSIVVEFSKSMKAGNNISFTIDF